MPPIVFELAAKYGGRALAILLLIVSIVAGYYYWKHNITLEATNKAIERCNESKEKFRIDAEHFRQARQEEVDKLKAEQDERLKNAIQTYIAHYESIRNTPVATSLRIKTNSASSGCYSVPGTDKSGTKTETGTSETGEAELSSGNLRKLNEVIDSIERLELKCEQLLNSVE